MTKYNEHLKKNGLSPKVDVRSILSYMEYKIFYLWLWIFKDFKY